MKARAREASVPLGRAFPLPRILGITRQKKDLLAARSFYLITALPLLLLILIGVALLLRARPILETHRIWELLSGQTWRPLQGLFGFLPFITGTLWVTVVAMLLAIPPCLLASIYLAEYANRRVNAIVKPLLDLLAGIPSVVYGVWGIVAIVPVVQAFSSFIGPRLGFIPIFHSSNPTGFSILSGSVVLAVMVAPFMIAVTYEVMEAVPHGLREASLAIGATRWQTVKHVLLPQTLPGIIAGIVLSATRALGETMAVLMVVGNVASVPHSIFDPAYPLPALIANNYGEMMSIPLYDAALLGAALVLLLVVLVFNVLSTLVLWKITGNTWG